MKEKFEDISLMYLANFENLSVRAYNTCASAYLWTLKDILEYYYHNKTFKKLRNCGKVTNNELILLSKKYYSNYINSRKNEEKKIEKNGLGKVIDNLSLKQKSILNAIAKSMAEELSVRAYNALSEYLMGNFSIKNIYNLILSDKIFKTENIKNVGVNSAPEIKNFINELYEYIQLISLFEDEQNLEFEYYKAILSKYFSHSDIDGLENFVTKKGQIQLFYLIQQLFEKKLIFNDQKLIIFNNVFNYFENLEYLDLEELAPKVNLTKERIRQIRESIYKKINYHLQFVSDLNIDFEFNYSIDTTLDIISIDQATIDNINFQEGTSYNIIFFNKILSICTIKTHDLVGREKELIFNIKRRSNHNWKSTYIVSKELTSIFDFDKFVDDVSRRLNKRILETYFLHFQAYLIKFLKTTEYKNLDRIASVCEKIIFYEFGKILDQDENIVFNSNIKIQTHKIAKEILEEAQKPLNVEDIYAGIIHKYPNYKGTLSSIRSSMTKNKGFIYFGRQSTYGLKKWEKQYSDIKGGTIRDITEEFLSNYDKPKHISDITKYVNQYRKTNARNIYYNLRMEENNRFVFYKNNYIGIKRLKNTYINEFINYQEDDYKPRRSWEENYRLLKNFLVKYKRHPQYNGNDEEKRLSRFCTNTRYHWKEGKLTSKQIELLKSIDFKFNRNNSNVT